MGGGSGGAVNPRPRGRPPRRPGARAPLVPWRGATWAPPRLGSPGGQVPRLRSAPGASGPDLPDRGSNRASLPIAPVGAGPRRAKARVRGPPATCRGPPGCGECPAGKSGPHVWSPPRPLNGSPLPPPGTVPRNPGHEGPLLAVVESEARPTHRQDGGHAQLGHRTSGPRQCGRGRVHEGASPPRTPTRGDFCRLERRAQQEFSPKRVPGDARGHLGWGVPWGPLPCGTPSSTESPQHPGHSYPALI